MLRRNHNWHLAAAACLLAASAVPALADVRSGVEAWGRGDYAAAVAQWEGPAAVGDADAMFNLAQAYRLGRGVARDSQMAESLYYRAAQAGHLQAADTYGLMLFQDGRRQQALPYVQDAARRGDPRSQYLLGIALFNGDQIEKDWIRAYALLTLANAAGLPQAAPALAQMDQHIPIAQRQQAAGLAERLRTEAEAARAVELAAADLANRVGEAPPAATPRVPRPIATATVSPSIAAAQQAVADARRATGTLSPAEAGASYAGAPARPPVAAAPAPQPSVAASRPAVASGPWRVQLGAFSVAANAERLWNNLSSRRELSGRQRLLVPAGRVTKLQAGGYQSRSEAESACRALRTSGQDCLVTRQ